MEKTPYQILGVQRNAKPEEIKRAYFRATRRCHPDLYPNDDEKAQEFAALQEAYEILSDVQKRRKYDAFDGLRLGRGVDDAVRSFWERLFHL